MAKHAMRGTPVAPREHLIIREGVSMARMKLTAAAVERVKPPASGRTEYWDALLPGFGLRVTANGDKSW